MSVGRRENNHPDEQRSEHGHQGVQASATCVAGESFTAGLNGRGGTPMAAGTSASDP